MTELVKKFIEDNIKLIELNEWEEIYEKASAELKFDTGKFTEVILEAGIHPENYLTELPDYFLYESDIEEFIIPNNITSIGYRAFKGCTSFTSIVIPKSVTSMDYGAFSSCKSLINVTIDEDVKEIGEDAFCYCRNLTTVIIRNPEIVIAASAFVGCPKLDIQFNGTMQQWKTISYRKFRNALYTCNCLDGIIKKSR